MWSSSFNTWPLLIFFSIKLLVFRSAVDYCRQVLNHFKLTHAKRVVNEYGSAGLELHVHVHELCMFGFQVASNVLHVRIPLPRVSYSHRHVLRGNHPPVLLPPLC